MEEPKQKDIPSDAKAPLAKASEPAKLQEAQPPAPAEPMQEEDVAWKADIDGCKAAIEELGKKVAMIQESLDSIANEAPDPNTEPAEFSQDPKPDETATKEAEKKEMGEMQAKYAKDQKELSDKISKLEAVIAQFSATGLKRTIQSGGSSSTARQYSPGMEETLRARRLI